jgi:hypothetical protein
MKSIDEEFAALEAEMARLTAATPKTPEDNAGLVKALEALKADWLAKSAERTAWRRRVDEAMARAIDRTLAAGQAVDAHGNLKFKLDNEAVQKEGRQVLEAVVEGLAGAFMEKWAAKPEGDAPAKPDGAAPAASKTFDATDLAGLIALLVKPKLKKDDEEK